MLKPIAAISIGASLGALLRWWLGTELNGHFPAIPPGTLAANLIGAYVIGLGIALFASFPGLAPEWRLFVDHRVLRRPDDLLDVLRRDRHVDSAGTAVVDVCGGRSRTSLVPC